MLETVLAVGHTRGSGQVVQRHIFGLVEYDAVGGVTRRVEVLGDVRLAVDHHRLARVFPGIDEQAVCVGPDNGAPVVQLTVAVHSLAHASRPQQLDGTPLEHASAYAAQHVLAGVPLQHDALDPVPVQDLREQQPGRAASDNRNLGLHVLV